MALSQQALQFIQKRQIPLLSQVNGESQELVTNSVLYLNTLGVEPITLFIDSLGGLVKFGDIVTDAVRLSAAPIHGIVVGYAHSAAFWILQNCHCRSAYPSASMMFHGQDLNGLRVDQRDFAQQVRLARSAHAQKLEIVAQRTGQPLQKWKQWSRQEKVFYSLEALSLNIIDEIVHPAPLLVPA